MIETYKRADHMLVIDRTGRKPKAYRIPKDTPPGMIQKAINFSKAATKHVRAGRPKATQAVIDARFAMCMRCEFLNKEKMHCSKCGCGIKEIKGPVSKLSWADSKCPIGRWLPVKTDI